MKKLLKISSKIILFFVFALFSSCEKDLYEEAIIESKSKVNYVTIEEVPFLIPNIQEFNHDYDYLTSSNKKKLNKESLNLNLELDRILEYISTTGEKTYSINIIKEFLPYHDKYVENLSVFKVDDSYKSLLIKYNENDDLKNFDFSTFTGEVSFSTIDNVLISFMTMVDGNKFHYKEIDGVLTYYGDGFDVVISADGTVTINYHPPISSNGNTGSNGNTESNGNTGGAGPIGNNSGTGGAGSNNSEFVYSLPHINITPNPPLPITQFLTQLNDSTINYSQNFYNLDLSAQSVIVTYLESINYHATTQIKASLIAIFSNTANNNWLANADETTQVSIFNNLVQNNFNNESTSFVNEVISLSSEETNQEDVNNLINITFLINDNENNLFEDSFAMSLDPYVDLDLLNTPDPINLLGVKIYFNYRKLRSLNPEWSKAKCFYESSKSVIHIALDGFGLIPVGGEIADLVNGVLYTIEGDGLNATLSYASAVPIIGWTAAGTKFGVRIASTATGVTKLVWKVTGTVIEFGNSGQLRKVLNVTSSALQAHHLIPWASRGKMAIQKAAKYSNAFHMNEALNGIAVAAWRNQPNHTQYNNLINIKLDAFRDDFPNASPQQCYNFLTNLIQDIRTWVINNPNSHLNDLVLP